MTHRSQLLPTAIHGAVSTIQDKVSHMDKITFLVDKINMSANGTAQHEDEDRTVKLTSYDFQGKLTTLIENIARSISHVDTSRYNYEVDEASFSINVSEDGNLSILSLLDKGIGDNSGIQIKLKRKQE